MALQKSWNDSQTGLEVPEAYHKINGLVLDYVAKQAQFVVLIYRDASARTEDKHPFTTRSFGVRNIPSAESQDGEAHAEFDELFSVAALSADGVNPVAQAYMWLKGQGLYKSAVDV